MLRIAARLVLIAGCLPVFAASAALSQEVELDTASSESLLMDQSTLPNAIDLKGTRPKADPSVTPAAATTLPADLDALSSPDSLALPDVPSQVTIRELRPLTLAEVEQLAEVNSPLLKIAASQVDQAKSEVLAKTALWYPTVSLLANGLPQYLDGEQYRNPDFLASSINPDTRIPQTQPDTYSAQWSANFQASVQWDLINPARVPSIAGARDALEKSNFGYLIALRDLRLEASTFYFRLQRADEQVRIGQEGVRASLVSLRDADARYRAGVATKVEVLEAQNQLALDRQTLTNGLRDQSKRRRDLAKLLNLPEDVTPTAASPASVTGLWQPSLQESIIAAYAFREELDQFLLDISINNSNANSALAAVQPSLTLSNGFTTNRTQGQSGRQGSIDFDDYRWSVQNAVGLNVSWNIFDGGASRANYRKSKQKAEESKFRFAKERDLIRNQVEESFFDLRAASQNIYTTTRAVRFNGETLRLVRLRFQAGVTTQREVVDAQRDLTRSEVDYAQAIEAYNISIANLRRRTGLDQVAACPSSNLPATKSEQPYSDIPIEPIPIPSPCEDRVPAQS